MKTTSKAANAEISARMQSETQTTKAAKINIENLIFACIAGAIIAGVIVNVIINGIPTL